MPPEFILMRHGRVLCRVRLIQAPAICGAKGVVNSARDKGFQQILRKVLDGRRGETYHLGVVIDTT